MKNDAKNASACALAHKTKFNSGVDQMPLPVSDKLQLELELLLPAAKCKSKC